MSDITWEDPNADGRGRARKDWPSIADQLRANPGAWALIDTEVSVSNASAYRVGRNKAFPVGDFEFTLRGVTKAGRAQKLYARFVGGEVA